MIKKIKTLVFRGIKAVNVDIQIQLSPGIPNFIIVGLADKTIAESKERVKGALSAIGISMPNKKITVNLSPANLLKEGSHFDLALSLAVLSIIDVIQSTEIQDYVILGELSLDGSILGVSGVLPSAIEAKAQNLGIICPYVNTEEAILSGNDKIISPSHILQLINHLKGSQLIPETKIEDIISKKKLKKSSTSHNTDLKDIIGQKISKKALEITAAGRHNLLMYGPPGTGKSMLASRIVTILPDLSFEEILESSTIFSVAGMITNGELISKRPFRNPHHSCTEASMVGGGVGYKIHPGEVSLAHNGILFLDEFPEFKPKIIDSLRQPIETKEVLISRSGYQVKYPAHFQLIAAMNPCKCGYLNDDSKSCGRAPICAINYQSKISGPILDRFDLKTHVLDEGLKLFSKTDPLSLSSEEESSAQVKERVLIATEIQKIRYKNFPINFNSEASLEILKKLITLQDNASTILNTAAKKFNLSMRGYVSILKVARTIADLERKTSIDQTHISEAINYRIANISKSIQNNQPKNIVNSYV